jgi:hypothetical protein
MTYMLEWLMETLKSYYKIAQTGRALVKDTYNFYFRLFLD